MISKILLIYTGGTIGMIKDYSSGVLKPFDFSNIFNYIPELEQIGVKIDFIPFENPIDSSDIEINDWVKLSTIIEKKYQEYDGFVVLHGTDTMSYTASMLSFMLQGLQKPVIFTGSQLPIGELRTDSKENLITSVYYAGLKQNNKSVIREVCLYFEHKLYRANRTTKFSAEHFDAFISPNYPVLGESGVNLGVYTKFLLSSNKKLSVNTLLSNQVDIFTFFPGKNKRLLDTVISNPDIKGVILRTFGSGNIPSDEETIKTISKAKDLGKELVVITQCMQGSVTFGKYQNSVIFKKLGIIDGFDITVESAITKLMWLLAKNYSSEIVKKEFEKSIAGELSVL